MLASAFSGTPCPTLGTRAQANQRLAWRTGYDRVTNKYYVTILVVGSKATVPIATTPRP